jgi:PAT family beta-lactamase induction signal transducer AmpG
MGLCNMPFGLYGGVMLTTIPQMLAARGVPQPEIASITAIGLSPGFIGFLVSPILDVRFSRKTYAYLFGFITALLLSLALASTANIGCLTVLLFSGQLAAVLYSSALGGWFGILVRAEDEAQLGTWFAIGNFGGYGLTAMVGILLIRELPFVASVSILCLMVLSPVLIISSLPASKPDQRLASESFGRFFADVLGLLRKPVVLGVLPFFITPCASFALTNTLGALGNDFATPEETAGTIVGVCTSLASFGSLLVPPLARYISLRPLYLLVGSSGALFTLSLIVLPHTATSFALAVLGENVFATAATAVATAIIFDTIGRDNPLAATQFAVLNAAILLPPVYMQELDGVGYGWGGLTGNLLMDATLSLIVCGALGLVLALKRWRAPSPQFSSGSGP